MTNEDYQNILKLEQATDNGEKDGMLFFLVEECLCVNNYILNFLKRDLKVPIKNNEEKILDLVQSDTNFSFRTTEKYYEIDDDSNPKVLTLLQPKEYIKLKLKVTKNCENNKGAELDGNIYVNFLTTKEIKVLQFAKKIKEIPNRI